jgi:hypothetical protein
VLPSLAHSPVAVLSRPASIRHAGLQPASIVALAVGNFAD